MVKVSVLLPVYNVEAYLAESLASIQSQTLSDIEVIIVDDGSTDGTRAIAERAAAADARVQVVAMLSNRGLVAALNQGLTFCRAPFIARMDGDDIALPTRLEMQLRFLEENPGVALVGCATKAINEQGKPIPGFGVSLKPSNERDIANTMLFSAPCLHIWMARAELYEKLGGYRELRFAEDFDFLLRAVSAGFRISNLCEPLMLIRKRSGNLSSSVEQRKMHKYIVGLHRERMRYGKDSFSRESCERKTKGGGVEMALFRLSTRCLHLGVGSSNRVKRWSLAALSVLISPWQARYFLDRLRCKLILRAQARVG